MLRMLYFEFSVPSTWKSTKKMVQFFFLAEDKTDNSNTSEGGIESDAMPVRQFYWLIWGQMVA